VTEPANPSIPTPPTPEEIARKAVAERMAEGYIPQSMVATMMAGIVKETVKDIIRELRDTSTILTADDSELEDLALQYTSPRALQDRQHPEIMGETWQIQRQKGAPVKGTTRQPMCPDFYTVGGGLPGIDFRGRKLREALEDPMLALWFQYLSKAKPLVPTHLKAHRSSRDEQQIAGTYTVKEERLECITKMCYLEDQPLLRGTTSEANSFILYTNVPPRPRPTNKAIEPPYPEAFYAGPHPEFVQIGGVQKLPGFTGRCIFIGATRVFEHDHEELYQMLLGSQTQEYAKAILENRLKPSFYCYDPYIPPAQTQVTPLEMPNFA
jgi:hypothetical protein